ncbi:BglG family transcription antiterminator [Planomicrobium sp. CPCC 101079]|uniref:BglG family transcription antiterminator n=1 Tax=Planomicrobium sp. CPCC 101079 TaxID=2599618 RepID=UPI0011B39711|nr:BglG family transcription antiterminator [Planomicrobium sp. CPCC 101079]TWT13320.1 transcription antiterminator [Planomicrobium sp. CPCC 101079]
MALDQRSHALLSYLAQTQGYVPLEEITEKFNISRRTIYYDIDKINSWLKDNNLPAVQHVRSAGFHLEKVAASHIPEKLGVLKSWHYEYSGKERKAWLTIYLMTRNKPMYLENLMEKLRVSRNTTINDIKALKKELVRFNLQLEFDRKSGYVLIGKEEDKRKALVFYLEHALPKRSWQNLLVQLPAILSNNDSLDFLGFEKLLAVERIVSESEQELNVQFTDEFLHSFSFRLLLFGRRLAQGQKVEVDEIEKKVLSDLKEYKAAQKISEELTLILEVEFPEDEIFYITKHLLSSRVQFSELRLESGSNQDSKILAKIVSDMVTDFQKYACILFENRQEVEANLLLHVKPAYYRVLYGIEAEDSMTDSIKEKYPDIFQLSKKVSIHLERATEKPINDNEIALIAAHFGGWLERTGVKPASRKKALLVCTSGVGTSRLLQHQLEELFSTVDIIGCVSMRDYEKDQSDADFIISTIPIAEKERPVFVVNPILAEAEKESLLKKVNALMETVPQPRSSVEAVLDIVRNYADIKDIQNLERELRQYFYQPQRTAEATKPELGALLRKEHIQTVKAIADWREGIRQAAAPLLKGDFISEGYVQAMVHAVDTMGPYIVISPKVAIPHARPQDGVKKIGMSLLRVEQGISFSNQEKHLVHLIIVLAAIDGDSHLKALGQLVKILNDAEVKEGFLAANSPDEIHGLLLAHSH